MSYSQRRIQTYIFVDLEATDLITSDSTNDPMMRKDQPGDVNRNLTRKLEQLIENDRNVPKITEMSFVSVPRRLYREAMQRFIFNHRQRNKCLTTDPISNIHTRQFNPLLDDYQWKEYEEKAKNCNALRLRKVDLLEKNTFADEWPSFYEMLRLGPKPVLLLAHNGVKYDFRLLYNELKKNNLLQKYPLPSDVLFLDTLVAFMDIEKQYHLEHITSMTGIDWGIVDKCTQPIDPSLTAIENECVAVTSSQVEIISESSQTLFKRPSDYAQLIKTPEKLATKPASSAILEAPIKSAKRKLSFGTPEINLNDSESIDATKHIKTEIRLDDADAELQEKILSYEALPMKFFDRRKWSPAKVLRTPNSFFKRSCDEGWIFDELTASHHFCTKGNFTLSTLFEQLTGQKPLNSHRAQGDCDKLMQVSMAFGDDFVKYADTYASEFPMRFRNPP